jgi:hypothetical protein
MTGVRFQAADIARIGQGYALNGPRTLRALQDVVKSVAANHQLGGTVERTRDTLIDRIRRFFRASGRDSTNTPPRQGTPAHDPEYARRLAEAKNREQAHDAQKATERASEVAFAKMLGDPNFLAMKAFSAGAPAPVAAPAQRPRVPEVSPEDRARQDERDAKWWAEQRAALDDPPPEGPP